MVRLTLDTDFEFQKNFVLAIFYTLVAMGLEALMRIFTPSLLSILPYQSAITYIVAFFVVFAIFTFVNRRRKPIGLRAYLFFPKNTEEEDKSLDYNLRHDFHRAIVNLKTRPYAVYDLTLGSYAWKLVERAEKQGKRMWVEETDTAPNDSDFLRKWSKRKRYVYGDYAPDRKVLLLGGSFIGQTPLDPRFKEHVEWRAFLPVYCYLPYSPIRIPHRRIILNYSTMEAFPLDMETYEWASSGAVRGHIEIQGPRLSHARKWAEKNKFHWNINFARMSDLLKKGQGDKQERLKSQES